MLSMFLQEKYLQMVGFSTSMLVYRRVPSGWKKNEQKMGFIAGKIANPIVDFTARDV